MVFFSSWYWSITSIFTNNHHLDEEELRSLRVDSIDLTATFYKNRDRLQANVRRVNLTHFTENLKENAFTYLVVSLEPPTRADSSYFESELRPVAGENYFEEASEFEVGRGSFEIQNNIFTF